MLARNGAGLLANLRKTLTTKFNFTRFVAGYTAPPICPGRDTSEEASGCPFDCEKEVFECHPKKLKDLMSCQDKRAAVTCETNQNKNKDKDSKPPKPFVSMWETIPGYRDKDCILRLDNLHYKPSDKNSRKYQMTWEPCPSSVKRRRKICCFESAKLPTHCKGSKRSTSSKSACESEDANLKQDYHLLKMCLGKKIEKVSKCEKIVMPYCPAVAKITRCARVRLPTDCQKVCTPYPSYSECQKDPGKKPHPRECGCLSNAMVCESMRFFERKKKFSLPPDLPAWPPRPK